MLATIIVRKWIAVALAVLAASPLTAPFQTYGIVNHRAASETAAVTLTPVELTTDGFAPGSLVPPLPTQPGRLKVLIDVGSALSSPYVITSAPLISLAHRIVPPPWSAGVDPPLSSTVLRV